MKNKYKRIFQICLFCCAFLVLSPLSVYAKPNPENGVNRLYFDNGKVRFETYFKNGTLVRKRAFYKNGRVKLDYRYKNEQAQIMRNFYENGKLKGTWNHKNGKTKLYHPNGKLYRVIDPISNK